MNQYQKPAELYDGLRLHQNENTAGCSPRVLDALRSLRADQISFYPPYAAAIDACARHLGVPADSVALVNGLDEGITGIAIAYLRSSAGGFVPEAIVPEPAFEIFKFDTEVVGGRPVSVMPRSGFQLSARRRARGDHAANAGRVPDQPEQSDRRADAARGDPHDRAGGAARSHRVRRRGLRRLLGDDVHSRAAVVPQRHRRPDVLEGVRAGRAADRLPRRRGRSAGSDPPRDRRSTA